MSELFHLLSRGGAKFDKKRFKNEVELFNPKQAKSTSDSKKKPQKSGELPPELDFFKYAQGGNDAGGKKAGKGKGKKRAIEEDELDEDGEEEDGNESQVDSQHETGRKRKREEEDSALPKAIAKVPLSHRVTTTGSNVPESISSFSDLSSRYSIAPQLLRNVEQNGYAIPTGIQAYGIPTLLESRDVTAVSPTGTGKTLSYLLPIFSLLGSPSSSRDKKSKTASSTSSAPSGSGIRALILSPTQELAAQIYNECLKLAQGRKWKVVLYSKATGATLAQKDVRDKVDIVVSTPLRLVAALQEGTIELNNVRHLILDEADRLLEEGFLEQTREIVSSCTHLDVQKAVFSATMPAGVEAIAKDILSDPVRVVVGLKDAASVQIRQTLTYVGTEAGKLTTLRQLLASAPPLPLLVFVQSRERAAELHQELIYDGISVDVLHSDMTRKQRDDSVRRLRAGETWVMVCTEVMARGMDFGGIRGVLNYDFPQSVQSYIHRIGRTGRAGRDGEAITYFTDADAPYLKSIANVLKQSGSSVPDWILALPKPSKMKRRALKKKPVERKSVGVIAGRGIGKGESVKKREMKEASKRRKLKNDVEAGQALSRPEADADSDSS
ncbi:hypothetical protein BOTBODRAFT_35695 [Botryobasidium botryosum FD-172 SS1]|uniref:RNA helicase n=1 Tax=Botryobasidium botryosum (strain FD-172 SS1) TaxID=930990 RepID=A0A067MHV2_BOTB1|nr:hypothetical protein BOTBODRAFT_35695 [Botryobasidium botryosum FD-172 SS1]